MSSDLSIRYAGPIPFDRFVAEAQLALRKLLDHPVVPELIEFSAPFCVSTRPRRQHLGPEVDWLMLGFVETHFLFELGVFPEPPWPEFRVELKGGPPLACAAAVSAAAALAGLNRAVVLDAGQRFTRYHELSADRFLEEVPHGEWREALRRDAAFFPPAPLG